MVATSHLDLNKTKGESLGKMDVEGQEMGVRKKIWGEQEMENILSLSSWATWDFITVCLINSFYSIKHWILAPLYFYCIVFNYVLELKWEIMNNEKHCGFFFS